MTIEQIDENFKLSTVKEEDVEWINANDTVFSLSGVFYDEKNARYARLDDETAQRISADLRVLATHTSGGRLRFVTDSPYVAVKAVIPKGWFMNHIPVVATYGFSLYADGRFEGIYTPDAVALMQAEKRFAFEGIRKFSSVKNRAVELYFPLYNGVEQLYIGVKKGSSIKKAACFDKWIVFYGSSITQGGCASRPGNDYAALVSRWLNVDYLNLGFSGNGKAEPLMAEYLASLHADLYVLDYDYNAPNVDYLATTHLPLYKKIREKNQNAPIVLISKPDFEYDAFASRRRDIIAETYQYAKKQGDKWISFIEGERLYGTFGRDGCSVDTCHPNDLGFYRIAETLLPVLKKYLGNCKSR